jgi:hypothetical protein
MKYILSLAIAFISITFTSCSKDYECVCYLDGVEKYNYSISAQTDKSAKELCAEKESTLDKDYNCLIK